MKRELLITACVLAVILMLGITLYPLISNYFSEKNKSLIETQYTEAVSEMDNSELREAIKLAQGYNNTLVSVSDTAFTKEALQEAAESYDELLNIRGDGIMGYIEIPVIGVDLPIYHGTTEDIVAGRFLIVGLGEENFASIPEELQAKYMELFRYPEEFTRIDDKIIAIPVGKIDRKYDRTADIPLYLHDSVFALYHGQIPEYKRSYGANVDCRDAIEKAISTYYSDNRLPEFAGKDVLEEFGKDRVKYVIANTIRQKSWDARISDDNRQWASMITVIDDPSNRHFIVDKVHPGLLDLFADQIRRSDERPSVLDRLKNQPEQKPKGTPPVHREEER